MRILKSNVTQHLHFTGTINDIEKNFVNKGQGSKYCVVRDFCLQLPILRFN